MKNAVTITICGAPYRLAAEESSEYIQSVAKRVDDEMQAIEGGNVTSPKVNLAILAAVNICDQLMKAEAKAAELQQQLDELKDNNLRREKEDDEAKREIMRMRGEMLDMKQKLQQLEKVEKRK